MNLPGLNKIIVKKQILNYLYFKFTDTKMKKNTTGVLETSH